MSPYGASHCEGQAKSCPTEDLAYKFSLCMLACCIQVLVCVYIWCIHMLSVHFVRSRASTERNYLFIPSSDRRNKLSHRWMIRWLLVIGDERTFLRIFHLQSTGVWFPFHNHRVGFCTFCPQNLIIVCMLDALRALSQISFSTNFVKMLKYSQICMRYNAMKNELIFQ